MTIDEAMVDLSIQREVKKRLNKNHEADAIQLGIEALERYREERTRNADPFGRPLPSETKGV